MVSVANINVCLSGDESASRSQETSCEQNRPENCEKLTEINQTSDMNTFAKVNYQNITIFYYSSQEILSQSLWLVAQMSASVLQLSLTIINKGADNLDVRTYFESSQQI